jgi:micrococcal nuclease
MLRFSILLSILIVGRLVLGQPEIEGKVIKVEEGDLIKILTETKDTVEVRLSNIDCPEQGQPYFQEAKEMTEKMCLNKKVRFYSKGTGSEGIETGIVYLSKNKTLNSQLLEEGLAWYYQKGLQITIDTQTLANIAEEAKASKKGLWVLKDPVAPWVYKRNSTRYEAKSSI